VNDLRKPDGTGWAVLADPEGNEFCVLRSAAARGDVVTDSFASTRPTGTSAVLHAASPDYGFARFAAAPVHLSDVVRFDRPRLGDITGLRAVHLQCPIGTDMVSLCPAGRRP
jgi:hypothetical protein